MKKEKIFTTVSEKEVTRAIAESFLKHLSEYAESDVIIVGGGPSGLYAGAELAKSKIKTLIIERNNYLGGGFWIGGYLMNKITVREPAQDVLKKLKIPYEEANKGLYVADGPHACSKLIAYSCDYGAKFLNLTMFDDVVFREEGKVSGVVVNWTPVSAMPREITCVDPIGLEGKIIVDATGHDACVVEKLEERGILKTKGFGAMWVEESEDLIVEHTSEVHPGLVVCGMAVSTTFGLPRMGPTFGGMLLSGKKAAEVIKKLLK